MMNPSPRHLRATSQGGSVLLSAVLAVAVLAAISATVLLNVSVRKINSYQAASWRESLATAEAGVERALSELRRTIDTPDKAWEGWTVVNADGTPAASQTINRDPAWPSTYILRKTETLPAQAGETKQPSYTVTVDVPPTLAPSGRRSYQSYRIRSTGYAAIPAAARQSTDSRDSRLRKLSLVWDRFTGARLASPQAARTIEVIAKPSSVYTYGVVADINFKMNKKTFIDGYNSLYPENSTNGRYDPAKRTAKGGTVLANRWKKNSKPDPANQVAEKFDVGKATIYGDLLVKGSLKNVKNTENVQGSKVTNVSVNTTTNLAPNWPTFTASFDKLDGKIPSDVASQYKLAEKQAKAGGPAAQFEAKAATAAAVLAAKGMELVGGSSAASPTRYKVGKIEVDKKDESLVLSNPPGVSESWLEIWLTDDSKIEKGGTVFVSNGVHATIYLSGKKLEVKETKGAQGGFIVESGYAGDLQIIGVEKPESTKETDDEFSPRKRSGKILISDADFTGVINAPDWDIDFKPKDWDKEDTIYGGQLFGSVLGRKVKIGNGADYHYDEALHETGKPMLYTIAGWNEI